MADTKYIGQNYTPPDLVAKVTGRARYAEDFRAEGMLFAKLLTSPMPHCRVRNIDASAALAMPGVKGILTADDLPDLGPNVVMKISSPELSCSGTGSAPRLPGSRGAAGPYHHNTHVSFVDGRTAYHELDSILCLDDPRPSALLFLWPETQYAEGRESRSRGIVECSDGLFAIHGNKRGSYLLLSWFFFRAHSNRKRGAEAGTGSSSIRRLTLCPRRSAGILKLTAPYFYNM